MAEGRHAGDGIGDMISESDWERRYESLLSENRKLSGENDRWLTQVAGLDSLSRFYVDVSRDGEAALTCFDCHWQADEWPDDLAGLVAQAVAHRHTVVLEGTAVDTPG